MRVIICGGRDYLDQDAAFRFFDSIHKETPITHVIEGGQTGGDTLGRWWAMRNNIPHTTVRADWNIYGKRAGYLRNKAMRDNHNPDCVIALPGHEGTQMMIDLAREKNIPVRQMELV